MWTNTDRTKPFPAQKVLIDLTKVKYLRIKTFYDYSHDQYLDIIINLDVVRESTSKTFSIAGHNQSPTSYYSSFRIVRYQGDGLYFENPVHFTAQEGNNVYGGTPNSATPYEIYIM